MIPRGFGRPIRAWNGPGAGGPAPTAAPQPRSEVLTIRFVRVAAGRVSGSLAPYADPETGARLFTAFDGQMRGDTIAGVYTTRAAGAVDTQTGEWTVTRRKP
jgi:hypothetical protein